MLVCSLLVLVVFGAFVATDRFSYAKSPSKEVYQYKVYLSALSELYEMPQDARVIDLGFCYEVTSSEPISTRETGKTMGHTTVFKCSRADVARILSQNSICVTNSYQIGECSVLEGYVRRGSGECQAVQVAFSNNLLSIGSPVIFGSY